ncbi:MAG: hypothetical protein AAFY37_13005, partial [Pseudomonadota bacterium]
GFRGIVARIRPKNGLMGGRQRPEPRIPQPPADFLRKKAKYLWNPMNNPARSVLFRVRPVNPEVDENANR